MFMLAEYVNMTTVSALATTMFLGGWQAPFPFNLIDGANSGWWPLLWFAAKVRTFMFVYMWLRATLPRLRYDQFMALGWKLLIPVSLGWIVVVAVSRTIRGDESPGWVSALISLGAVVTVVLVLLVRRTLRRNAIPEFTLPTDPGAVSVYPVPPIPSPPRRPAPAPTPREHSDV